jgi:hypothetical protein
VEVLNASAMILPTHLDHAEAAENLSLSSAVVDLSTQMQSVLKLEVLGRAGPVKHE